MSIESSRKIDGFESQTRYRELLYAAGTAPEFSPDPAAEVKGCLFNQVAVTGAGSRTPKQCGQDGCSARFDKASLQVIDTDDCPAVLGYLDKYKTINT